ncbi:retention module-containing protein [Campylobacter concisus]|uniref:Retention module-containing protein n=1 Tax=Campylobacter concisus TaxID=199 RepID=A0A7S9RDL2_9BACT|nr:retention module-containing protein [Campylobacter concisus]QPH89786.1 retention module-containing protein [Campylobacter concisus]
MQTQVGVIKQISGLVVAVDQNGVSRVLKVGDALYLGEVVKTSSASSKAVVSMDNGKDVTILGDESLKLDENVAAGQKPNTVADVSDLQKALLNGDDLTKLEETAAGGNAAAAGGGDGVSLGAASFDEGGHYSNINENFRSIGDLNSARGAERIGGVSGAADNAGGDVGFVDTTIPTVTLDPINNTSTVVTGKVPNPDPNTTVIVEIPGHTPVTVPVNPDGTFSVPTPNNEPLKPGTEVKVTPKDDAGNGTPVTTPVSDVTIPTVTLDTINNTSTVVTGKVPNPDPNTTVIVEIPGHTPVTVPVNPDGTFSVPTPNNEPLKPGTEVKVTPKDDAGNGTPVTTPVSDVTIPTVTLDTINNTSTVVTGKVPNPDPNTTVIVEIPGHTPVTVPVNSDGTFSVPTPNNEPLKPGTEVKVTPKDDAGNGTPVATPVSDVTIPTVTLDTINNTSTVVTGKVPNPDPNTTVIVEIPGHTPVTVPVNSDGTFSVPTPNNEPLKPGTEVKVTPKDDAGNGTPVATPVSDVVPPQVDLTPKADGTVDVVPHDNDATKVEISYTDNGGNTQTITVVKNPSAGWVVDSTPGKTTAPTGAFKLDPHSGKVTISDNATKDNTPVTAKATDGAGNTATGETTAPDKFTIKFNDDADGNGTITRGENYAEDGAKATATISIPNLAKDGSKIHVIGTGINDYYTVHKDASGNVTSVTDTKGNNVFDGDNGIKVSYDYNHYQTVRGNAASITAELEGTTLKATSSVKFENVGKAEVKFVELDEHGNVLNEKSDQITNQNRNTAMLDGDINHTTARISLPENVQDGDVVTVKYGYGPDAASLAKTGGIDTTAYKYFLVHKAADGSMTVDQITSADDKTPIKAGLTSTNGAGEKFGIDIHDMPTTTYNLTHSRGIEVTVKGDDHAEQSNGNTWIFRDSMEAPKVEFIEGNKVYNPSVSGSGSGALNAGISVADAIKDGDISHTTARITLPKVFSDGDKLTVAVTDYNKIYADTGVKQYPANNPEPTFVKAFIIHKAADGTVTFDEVDAAGNVTHAGIPALNNNAIEITGVPLYNMYENGALKSDYVHATGVDATITDHLNLNGNDSGSNTGYAFLANVNVVTITEVIDDVAGGVDHGNIKDNDVVVNGVTKKGLTNDSTPTFKGKADPNSVVELYDGTTKIGSTTTDKFGNWSITPATPLGEGAHSITASSPAINAIKASDPATITVDTGTKVTFDSVTDDVAGGVVNGNVKGNDVTVDGKTLKGLTNDNTPTLSGKAEAGSTVEIFNGTNKIGQVEAKGDGSWKFEVSTPLSDGEHELKVKTTDKAGNTAEAAPVTITVDTKVTNLKVEWIDDLNNDGKFSWSENLNPEHAGRIAWKAYLPNDGTVKVGDVMHYMWGGPGATGELTYTIKAEDIAKGYVGFVKQNMIQGTWEHIPFGKDSDGKIFEAWAYLTDAAGNKGSTGKDEIVFDFSDAPTIINASAIYGTNRTGLLLDDNPKSASAVNIEAQGKAVELDVKTFTHRADVKLGDGDDIVTVHKSGGVWGDMVEDSKLNLGDGDNILKVETNIDRASVIAGDGYDNVKVDGYITNRSNVNLGDGNNTLTVGTNIDHSTVETGSGNDTIKVGNYIHYSNIKLGAGDDSLTIAKSDMQGNDIDGGTGYDKLAITNPGTSINLDSIADHAHNFEELNISNKSQNTTLSVKLSDVISLTDSDNTLKITADAGDKVEFKDAGWQKGASTDGYTAYTNDTSGTTVTVEIKDEVTQPM